MPLLTRFPCPPFVIGSALRDCAGRRDKSAEAGGCAYNSSLRIRGGRIVGSCDSTQEEGKGGGGGGEDAQLSTGWSHSLEPGRSEGSLFDGRRYGPGTWVTSITCNRGQNAAGIRFTSAVAPNDAGISIPSQEETLCSCCASAPQPSRAVVWQKTHKNATLLPFATRAKPIDSSSPPRRPAWVAGISSLLSCLRNESMLYCSAWRAHHPDAFA